MTAALVDPAVTAVKFAREVEQFRTIQDAYLRRGIWLTKVEYPRLLVNFCVPQTTPRVALFGACIDFTNYDLWPPGVQLVDPFTQEPFTKGTLPTAFVQFHRVPVSGGPPGAAMIQQQEVVIAWENTQIPFLCLRGVREYHENPAHSGDSWLPYRGTGVGSLSYLVEQLHKYGVTPVSGLQVEMVPQIKVALRGQLE